MELIEDSSRFGSGNRSKEDNGSWENEIEFDYEEGLVFDEKEILWM